MKNLSENRLLEGMSETQVRSFCDAGTEFTIEPGEIVIREGQTNTDLYLIQDGELEVILPQTEIRPSEINLATLAKNEYVGEYGFLDSDPASASVKAVGSVRLFRIPYTSLRELMEAEPDIGRLVYRNLLLNLVARLRQSNDELDLFRPFS